MNLTLDFKRSGMWKVLVILIFGLASAEEKNYEIISCNDPNKESLHIIIVARQGNNPR